MSQSSQCLGDAGVSLRKRPHAADKGSFVTPENGDQSVETPVLKRSRLIRQAVGERDFHDWSTPQGNIDKDIDEGLISLASPPNSQDTNQTADSGYVTLFETPLTFIGASCFDGNREEDNSQSHDRRDIDQLRHDQFFGVAKPSSVPFGGRDCPPTFHNNEAQATTKSPKVGDDHKIQDEGNSSRAESEFSSSRCEDQCCPEGILGKSTTTTTMAKPSITRESQSKTNNVPKKNNGDGSGGFKVFEWLRQVNGRQQADPSATGSSLLKTATQNPSDDRDDEDDEDDDASTVTNSSHGSSAVTGEEVVESGGSGAKKTNENPIQSTPADATASSLQHASKGLCQPGGHQGDDNDGEDHSGKRPSKSKTTARKLERKKRLACPFQAHEPNNARGCFRPGEHNPRGGGGSIARVKQHMKRRHAASKRCQRCWAAFDHMKDLNSHVAKGRCSVSEKRPALLLGPQEEAELGADNRTQNRASETDKWWQLFRLAYPNMSNDEVDTLKAICPDYPYYLDSENPHPLISMGKDALEKPFPDNTIDNALTRHHGMVPMDSPQAFDIASASFPTYFEPVPSTQLLQPHDLIAMPPPSAPNWTGNDLLGFELQMPPCDSPTAYNSSLSSLVTPGTTPQITPNQSFEIILQDPPANEPLSVPPAAREDDLTQLRRNCDRLRRRIADLGNEDTQFRGTIRGDLERADNVVEEVLDMGNLLDVVRDRLEDLAGILATLKGRVK